VLDRKPRILETFGFRKRAAYFQGALSNERQKKARQLAIVDIGCGTGLELTDVLARHGYGIVGVDVHLPSLRLGRVASYVCGDTRALRSNSFDVAICSEVLEHVSQPMDMLLEVRRLLRPRGLCLVTVPNGFGPYEASDRAGRIARRLLQHVGLEGPDAEARMATVLGTDSLNYASRHVSFFTLGAVRNLFRAADFEELGYRGRTLLCGPVLSEAVAMHPALMRANEWAGDVAPANLVSGWMFSLRAP
jgi:SAM-dependent methyltransferase